MSKLVADTTLADLLLPLPRLADPLLPPTRARALPLQHRNTGQGAHLKVFGHLGWWKPWFCADLYQVWVSLGLP